MNPTTTGLLLKKINFFSNKVRTRFFQIRGLQVKKGTHIGRISCEWPNNLIVGSNCDVQDDVYFRIGAPFNSECTINIGDRVFIGHSSELVCSTKIVIGNDCFIGSNVTMNDAGHEYARHAKIKDQPLTTKKIQLEDDVWIGTSSVILQGVTIGKGAIISAGSIVNKSIPPYEIWAGVPARFIKKRE
jgi:acetyltransferase-like isoleucine patch superfamily enzyme